MNSQVHGLEMDQAPQLEAPATLAGARNHRVEPVPSGAATAAPRLVIRPILPADQLALQEAFERLSPASRRFRFHTPMVRMSDRLAHFLTHIDGRDHVALVACELARSESGQQRMRGLGVARFVRNREAPATAELAITVVDHAQGHGIAQRLLHSLAGCARERGIDAFTMLVLRDNQRVRRLLSRLGAVAQSSQGDVITLRLDVSRLERATSEVAAAA